MMSTLDLLLHLGKRSYLSQNVSAVLDDAASCPCLVDGTPPEMNPDVSGPGVRISFYLQALFLSVLAARSDKIEEINSALYTLMLTNVAMAVTTLVLGFDSDPGLTLQDALVVVYLLALSWCAVMSSLPMYNRHIKIKASLQLFAVIQTFVIFACLLAVLVKAQAFGSSPCCNDLAKLVIFGRIRALNTGRIIASIILAVISIVYAWVTYQDYKAVVWKCVQTAWATAKRFSRRVRRSKAETTIEIPRFIVQKPVEEGTSRTNNPFISIERVGSSKASSAEAQDNRIREGTAQGTGSLHGQRNFHNHLPHLLPYDDARDSFDLNLDGQLIVQLFVVAVSWSLFVLNTELLINANFSNPSKGTPWQFGQILPMFLVLLPFVNLLRAFEAHGLRKIMHKKHVHEGRKTKHRHRKGKKRVSRKRNISQHTSDEAGTTSAREIMPSLPATAHHRQTHVNHQGSGPAPILQTDLPAGEPSGSQAQPGR